MNTFVDVWAMIALSIGGVSLALRGYMLKPDYATWVTAPRTVSFSLVALAIVMLGRLISIRGGSHAVAGEAMVYTAQAVTASIMLANLVRQKPPAGILGQLLERLDDNARGAVERAIHALGFNHRGDRS